MFMIPSPRIPGLRPGMARGTSTRRWALDLSLVQLCAPQSVRSKPSCIVGCRTDFYFCAVIGPCDIDREMVSYLRLRAPAGDNNRQRLQKLRSSVHARGIPNRALSLNVRQRTDCPKAEPDNLGQAQDSVKELARVSLSDVGRGQSRQTGVNRAGGREAVHYASDPKVIPKPSRRPRSRQTLTGRPMGFNYWISHVPILATAIIPQTCE